MADEREKRRAELDTSDIDAFVDQLG